MKKLLLCVLLMVSATGFTREYTVACFEAKYYHPLKAFADRYAVLLPAEENPNSNEDLLMTVYIDISENRQVERTWMNLAQRQRDKWLCAEGWMYDFPERSGGRIIRYLPKGLVVEKLWKIKHRNDIPRDALMLERY